MSRPQPVSAGPLAGHVRQGRRYLPELAATGAFRLDDWVRDDLPDLIWPALFLALHDTGAARGFIRWQEAVQADLHGLVEANVLGECLDGRLTSLDRLVDHYPGAEAVVRRRAVELDLLPARVSEALGSYAERPAAWLVEADTRPLSDDSIKLLAKAVLEGVRDGHREAVIKCLQIWSAVQAGTFSSNAETIELLKRYPNDLDSRSSADSVVRASWGAVKGMLLTRDATWFDGSIDWANTFWAANLAATRCVRRRELEGQSQGDAAQDGDDRVDDGDDTPRRGDHLQRVAMDLTSSYVEALETSATPVYDVERQEVHAGLVSRVGREIITVLGCPDLWCIEHGSQVTRAIVEVRIYLEWMATQDSLVYRRFQDYGAGKAKLYARIMDELPAEESLPGISEAMAELDRLSHNHFVIDHRVVDTGDSFAGKSIRVMADECGLLDLYRRAYYISSGVAHSEWWSVETHAMERCLNLLHRGHLIPSLSLNVGGNVALAQSWVDQLYALTQVSLRILETDRAAVSAAFEWVEFETGTAVSS